MLTWLRGNPLTARLLIKLAVVLPLGLATGLLLAWACDALAVTQNLAALGAALTALAAGTRLANRLAVRLGIPEPDR